MEALFKGNNFYFEANNANGIAILPARGERPAYAFVTSTFLPNFTLGAHDKSKSEIQPLGSNIAIIEDPFRHRSRRLSRQHA